MANHLYSLEEDFLVPSSVVAVSQASGRTADNTLVWSRPNQIYVGTGAAASEALVYDFGAGTTLAGVFVDNINTQGITIQGNPTNSWGAPASAATFNPTTAGGALIWGRERIFCDLSGDLAGWGAGSNRYMRITKSGSIMDGSAVWKLGGVLPLAVVRTMTTNFGFPFDLEIVEPADVQARVGAPPEVSILGDKRFGITLSQPVDTSDLDADAQRILGLGVGSHMVFARNNGNLREAYCMRRTSRNAFSTTGHRTRSLQNVVFEEVA